MSGSLRTIAQAAFTGGTGRGLRIAVVDTGVHPRHPHIGSVTSAVAFDDDGAQHDDAIDRLGHGTAVAAAIHEKAPAAELLVVRVFDRQLVTTGTALVAGIRWAIDAGAQLINLSLGTANDDHRSRFEDVIRAATSSGVSIVAAAPTTEHAWLPGGLAGVIGVELDWSCPRDECFVSRTNAGGIRIRASGYPRPIPGVPPEQNLKGQSFAVANATGLLALALESGNDFLVGA